MTTLGQWDPESKLKGGARDRVLVLHVGYEHKQERVGGHAASEELQEAAHTKQLLQNNDYRTQGWEGLEIDQREPGGVETRGGVDRDVKGKVRRGVHHFDDRDAGREDGFDGGGVRCETLTDGK